MPGGEHDAITYDSVDSFDEGIYDLEGIDQEDLVWLAGYGWTHRRRPDGRF
jgi:hypothetical protein